MSLKSVFTSSIIVVLIIVVIIISKLYAQGVLSEGNEPYTPTKLQWFVVEMNALYSQDYTEGFAWNFVSKSPNTVLVFFSYHNSRKYSEVKKYMDHVENLINKKKERYDWDWIQVEFSQIESTESVM